MSNRPIYLDYSATTPVDPRVVEKMIPWLYESFGNPASRSHAFGWEAEDAVEKAREEVAKLVNADPREIVWTSGATESDNLAIKGAANFYAERGKHIITVKTEHKAVLDTCRELERQGFEVTYLDVQDDGLLSLDAFKGCAAPGYHPGVGDDGQQRDRRHPGHRRAGRDLPREGHHLPRGRGPGHRQGRDRPAEAEGGPDVVLGAQDVRPQRASARCMCGASRVRIEAQMHGGGHERGFRSGTLAHQIVGMGEAFRLAREEMGTENERVRMLRDRLLAGLTQIEEVYVNGSMEHRVPHNLNISFNYVEGESLIMAIKELAVSSGSACVGQPGAVLCAARAGPQRRAGAQLHPLHPGPLHDRTGNRLHDRTDQESCRQAARYVAVVGKWPRKALI